MARPTRAGKPGRLLETALDLHERYGMAVIPVRGKRPACGRWKSYQSNPPDAAVLRRLFAPPGITGLAVIHGPPSGGLVCRDFDRLSGYQAWKRRYPKLARTLPTARTRRGFHVYFVGPDGFDDYGDGEYRGDACHYTLLPPSLHPDGGHYEWVIPPGDAIPTVADPVACGLRSPDKAKRKRGVNTSATSAPSMLGGDGSNGSNVADVLTPCQSVLSQPGVRRAVALAIRLTVPTGAGRRNRAVFNLCRHLKGIPELAGMPAQALHPVVQEWHARALKAVRTQEFADTWADFLHAWAAFKADAGVMDALYRRAIERPPPPFAAERYGPESKATHLAALCRELQDGAGKDRCFYLSCREAGRLLGVSHVRASRYLNMLVADGVLAPGEPADRAQRRANEYRYVGGPGGL